MVLVLETISKKDFDRGYSEKGDLNGCYQDVIDFLAWTLNSKKTNNPEHLKSAIETLRVRFNMPYVTTKYLRGFLESSDASHRLQYLLKGAGYTTIPTKQYLREMRCFISHVNHTIFGNANVITEQAWTISRLSRCFVGRTLHKVVEQKDIDAQQQRFIEQHGQELLKNSLLEATKESPYSFLRWGNEITARQEKAIMKFQSNGQFEISHCKSCKHEIKIPADANQDLICAIYNHIEEEIKAGNKLCYSCEAKREKMLNENKRFDYSAILNQLEQLKNSIVGDHRSFSTPTLSFMMEFYRDLGLPSLDKVKYILDKANEQLNLNCEIVVKLDNIKFLFR